MDDSQHELNEFPDAIAARLRRADRSQAIVDPRTDRAVLDEARRYFAARPRRVAARTVRWTVPLGAAAAVLVAWLVVEPFGPRAPSPDDVDGSGRVDVLDVFALARAARGEAGGSAEARIDELAARIVSLGTPRSPQ